MKPLKKRLQETCDALLDDSTTPVMLTIVGFIFAVELAANIANGSGAIAVLHLTVIGSLEVAIVALLGTALVRKVRSFLKTRAQRPHSNGAH